jgi:acyl-coenzyme A synthetase/AMP-(fatty) acid ligase
VQVPVVGEDPDDGTNGAEHGHERRRLQHPPAGEVKGMPGPGHVGSRRMQDLPGNRGGEALPHGEQYRRREAGQVDRTLAGKRTLGLLDAVHLFADVYYKNPEGTAGAMRGGWFHTGDLAYRDKDGFYYIVDRKKDLVIRGGFNVYPREAEEVLYQHELVTEAAVIGRPDERLGEEVVAFLSLRRGSAAQPDELIAFCKERLYPREVRILDELPKSSTGKILKTGLRAL